MHKLLILAALIIGTLSIVLLRQQSASADKKEIVKVDDDGKQCKNAKFSSLADAISASSGNDEIQVCSGEYLGVLLSKKVHIKGVGNPKIIGGPAHPAGLSQGFRLLTGSGGSSFSNLDFVNVDLAIIGGEPVNNVTVEHNNFYNSIQGVSAWRAKGWTISQNNFDNLRTRCGGGIAILLGAYDGTNSATENVVSHNKVGGTLQVSDGDCGGYNGTGIVLYADHRFGRSGGPVKNNQVVDNAIDLHSNNPAVVDVVAIELTDTRDDQNARDIDNNAIGFNDIRGTEMQVVLTPSNLDDFNDISRNLGENRGHGLHPSVFGPGGN